jgi:hypothetical protein
VSELRSMPVCSQLIWVRQNQGLLGKQGTIGLARKRKGVKGKRRLGNRKCFKAEQRAGRARSRAVGVRSQIAATTIWAHALLWIHRQLPSCWVWGQKHCWWDHRRDRQQQRWLTFVHIIDEQKVDWKRWLRHPVRVLINPTIKTKRKTSSRISCGFTDEGQS